MKTKKCTGCGEEKPHTREYFHVHKRSLSGFKSECADCSNIRNKTYRESNRELINEKAHKKAIENKEAILAYNANYRDKNRAIIQKRTRAWYQNNLDANRKTQNKYYNTVGKYNIQQKLTKTIRSRTIKALKGNRKCESTAKLLGCSIEHAIAHLENQWTEGMDWDTHCPEGWHVDHILPCASFDLTDPAQQRLCFHYTNLQPMWGYKNIEKSDKIL